ncbi:hypothetical protein VCB98_01730 [Gammaproteobacteria bacterium AB-CW1]|uniref:Cobalt transport protein n=1 Tax=Natronospira elongata TaxID=3110268 RepID=A0AAP6MKQ1_9GAMM|nr:hypothetical protein [Gammaproteobacteria bacterium AB-CW1]
MPHVRAHLLLVLFTVISLPWQDGRVIVGLLVLLLAWHLWQGAAAMTSLGRGVWRLKWLLLGLMLVYLWLPGREPLADAWWPAMERGLVLLAMFASVHTLLFSTPPDRLGAALAEGLSPLDRVHLPGSIFARRLAMLLAQAVEERRSLAQDTVGGGGWFSWIPRRLAGEIRRMEARAAEPADDFPPLPDLGPTPWHDWLICILAALALLTLLWI